MTFVSTGLSGFGPLKMRLRTVVILSLMVVMSGLGVPRTAMAEGENGITIDQALTVILAARERAVQQRTLMNIAVVDAGANLTAFIRMDGAFLGSVDISIKKAKTARMFNMSTGRLGELALPGKPLYGIETSNGGLIVFAGGVPIKDRSGKIIGAIGVSGSTVEDDHEVALAGAAALR